MNKCDCLNDCGDDPWIAKGKAEPCDAYKRNAEERARRNLADAIAETLLDMSDAEILDGMPSGRAKERCLQLLRAAKKPN